MTNSNNLYKSLTIDERYKILKDLKMEEDTYALNLWRSEMSIISDKTFEMMLKTKKYSREIFSNAVNSNPESALIKKYESKANKSEWYKFFLNSLSTLSESNHQEPTNMNYVLRPFILHAKNQLNNFLTIENLNTMVTKEAIENLMLQLTQSLVDLAHKPLVLELNIQREEGSLEGSTSVERFQSFLLKFSNIETMKSFYNKYIVLTRLLSISTIYLLENIKKLLLRFREDKSEVIKKFSINEYRIQSIKLGEGDTHQEGNTVSIITFIDNKKVVYKPKKLDINIAFHTLIEWLNSHDSIEKLAMVKTLSYENYTYEEYIEYKPCSNLSEVESYYIQFGQLMGIFQLLNGTDIHMENLISHGKHPIVIDLETLIQEPMPLEKQQGLTMEKITNTIFHHVTRTMFLPTNGVKIGDPLNIDLSALNGREQKLDFKVLQPVNVGTDEMKYDFKDFHLEGSNNLPFIENDNISIDYTAYKDSIIQGFINVCEVFIRNKEELLKDKGILNKFNGILVRCLFRDTSQYANILMHMQHPELLTNMLDREKAIENMWAYPFPDKNLILSESKDMLNNDIPIFFNKTDKTSILDSRHLEIKDFYKKSPYDYLVEYINRLDNNEVNKQVSIIKLHFGDFSEYKRSQNRLLYTSQESLINLPSQEYDLLTEAKNIANYVMKHAYEGDIVSWIIPYNSEKNVWSLTPLKEDLYNGISGLYLFFTYLYQETGEEKYNEFSNKILEQCYVGLSTNKQFGLSGFPSFFYAFSLINDYGDNNLKINKSINEYCKFFEQTLNEGLAKELEIDYVNGITVLINALLRFYKKRKDIKFIELAIGFTNELEKRIDFLDMKPGYAHGALGYALTFFRMGKETNIQRYIEKAQDLINFEDSKFKEISENLSWCNGIIGEGIARLEIDETIKSSDNNLILTNITEQISNSSLLFNDCMCHGNMAITEFFLGHYLKTGNNDSYVISKKIAQNLIEFRYENGQYKLMDIKEYPDVSLFTGITGIGYQLLRLNNPQKVPAILNI